MDGGQATINELWEINLGTTDDPKSIIVSTMLNNEEVIQYEQLFQEYKDIFARGYQDTLGLDPNFAVHKLFISKGVKPMKQPQWLFRSKLTIQMIAKWISS